MNDTVSAEGLRLSYGPSPVVEGIELTVTPGKVTVLIGPNGCGKSTILRALAGLHAPNAGRVVLDGRDIARLGSKEIARRIGLLAQSATAPDGLTVTDLVRQGRYPHRPVFGPWRNADQAALDRALDQTGMTELAETPLDRLSGGQRQRAWIAMTLAQESGLVLLDEPTTYLDIAHQVEVLGLMQSLVARGRTTVVAVLHDLVQAARYADVLVLLKKGRIVAEGSPGAVLTRENLREAFGVDVTILTDPVSGGPICLPLPTI